MYQSPAIILRLEPRGEADQVVIAYTQNYGKVRLMGRGTKKVVSKLNPHIQLFTETDIEFVNGKAYKQLIGAVTRSPWLSIRSDIKKTILGSLALELIDRFTETEQRDGRLYQLLSDFFVTLEHTELTTKADWHTLEQDFIVQLMTILGYQPPLEAQKNRNALWRFLNYHLQFELNSAKFVKMLAA